jgi:signal transduction histidine kinase
VSHGSAGLPIRRWLALALVLTFAVPALVTLVVGVTQFGGAWHASAGAANIIRRGAAHWSSPTWQAATRRALHPDGVDFALMVNGRTIYRSTADPFQGTAGNNQRTVQEIVVPGRPRRVAYVYGQGWGWGGGMGAGRAFWLVPVAGLTALLLTLAGIGWFLRRTLIMPLAAASGAARQVAAGDLDIALPSSRVREVAELNAAFLAMSAELRASLQQQAAIEDERRLFVSAIAHDLRTPLFSLRGYLEGLEEGIAATPEKVAEYVRISREKADVLERLISDLFAYARIEYLEQTLQRTPLELGAVLSRVVEGRSREAAVTGVKMSLVGSSRLCMVQGDSQLLQRAVENVLDNALRHTGGTVEVEWHAGEGAATFTISDDGPGIGARDLPHVFEPMYRADPSRSSETGGAGLGLAIARRIMRAHGGDLTAANGAGGGAMFTGHIPLSTQESSEENPEPVVDVPVAT